PVVAGEREHAGVLPRAIRIHSRKPQAASRVVLRDALRERSVGPAQQVALAAADLPEQLAHARHLARLARVRRAHQRQLLAREAEPIGYSVFYERQRLERFRRRAPEGDEVGVAGARDQAPARVHHRRVDVVHRFHHAAAHLFNAHPRPPSRSPGASPRGQPTPRSLPRAADPGPTARGSPHPAPGQSPRARARLRRPSLPTAPRESPVPTTRSRSPPPARPAPPRSRSSRGSVAARSSFPCARSAWAPPPWRRTPPSRGA